MPFIESPPLDCTKDITMGMNLLIRPGSRLSFLNPPASAARLPSCPAPPLNDDASPPRALPKPPAFGADEIKFSVSGMASEIWLKSSVPSYSFAILKISPAPPEACSSEIPS